MAYTFAAMVAWDSIGKQAIKSTSFQVYDVADTGFVTPLAITDPFGNAITGNILNSGTMAVFPEFKQADHPTVVITDAARNYKWTITSVVADDSVAGFVGKAGSASESAVKTAAKSAVSGELDNPASPIATKLSATYAGKSVETSKLDKTEAASTYSLLTKSASALPTWVRKRTLNQLGQTPVRILCVGDSTTAGVYSDSYTTAIGSTNQGGPNSYPAQLAKRLTAAGIPAEHSFVLPGQAGNADARWPPGTWGYASLGAGGNGAVTSATVGQATTITPGIVADRYIVYYFGDPGTGTITAQATGGTAVTINTAQATGKVYASAVVSAATASTANTLTLTNAAGTVFAYGVEAYDSANPNKVRVMGAGVGGSRATAWENGGAPGALNFIKAIAPDLTIISLGVNDGAVPNSTAVVTAAIDAVAAAAAVSGDVLLMSAVPHGNPSVLDDYNAAYKASGRAYVDLQTRWGHNGQTLQFLTTDNTHPNAIGYGDMATAVALHLLSA